MPRTGTNNKNSADFGSGLFGAIIGVVGDELLFVGPRIKKAQDKGYRTGYSERDAQLQPIIQELQNKESVYRAEINSLRNQLAQKDREIEEIKKTKEKN